MIAYAVAHHLATTIDGLDFRPDAGGGNVIVQDAPAEPDEIVVVSSTGGFAQDALDPTDAPTVQVKARGPERSPIPPYERMRQVYAALQCLDLTWIAEGTGHDVFVVATTPLQSDPVPLGMDANQRHEWVLNFAFEVHAPTTHRPAITATA